MALGLRSITLTTAIQDALIGCVGPAIWLITRPVDMAEKRRINQLRAGPSMLQSGPALLNVDSWRADMGSSSTARGYGYKWQKARERFLRNNPLCVYCERAGRVELAGVVDHKTPHRGNAELFWTEANWQSLCKPCHDGAKAREERGGPTPQHIGADGFPVDPGAATDGLPPGGRVRHQKDRSF